jgi:hypothetical protein
VLVSVTLYVTGRAKYSSDSSVRLGNIQQLPGMSPAETPASWRFADVFAALIGLYGLFTVGYQSTVIYHEHRR